MPKTSKIKEESKISAEEKTSKVKIPRIATKKLLLTYSQCSISIESCFTALKQILKEQGRNITDYALSTEKHQDGSSHIHAYIELDKRIDTKNMRVFDISWEGKLYHPNIVKSKYKAACVEYILKNITDLNSTEFITSKQLKKALTIEEDKIKVLSYHETLIALARNNRVEEAMQLLEKQEPARFVSSHKSLRKSLTDLQPDRLLSTDFVDCTHRSEVMNVHKQLKEAHTKYITPMLVGETKTGKTLLMLNFIINTLKLKPLVVNNIDSIRYFDPSKHNTLFFDDCNFSVVQEEEMLLKLFDCESATTFNIKHGSVQIPAYTARFVCSNFLLSYYVGARIASQPRIARRLKVIDIGGQSLYQFLPVSNKTSEVEDDPSYDRNKDLYWAINLTKSTEI
jgi:Geminivirus Rep catalytic domain